MAHILVKIDHKRMVRERGEWRRPSDVARSLGISQQLFSKYEAGTSRVPADLLLRWCALLNIQPAEVIVEDDLKVLEALVAA